MADDESRIRQWAQWHAAVMLGAIAATLIFGRAEAIVITVLSSVATYFFSQRGILSHDQPLGGFANQITLLRLALLCGVAIGIQAIDWIAMFVLLCVNVLLDVLDGFVARRREQASEFGAVLDRETDAVFVLVVCLYFNLARDVGLWIMVQAVLPYFYRLVAWVLPNSPGSETKQTYAARLAGINFTLLLIAVVVPESARLAILLASTATVVLSFLVSFRDLFRYQNANSVL